MTSGAGFWATSRKIILDPFSLGCLLMSAVLTALCLPPYTVSLLAWIALIPLLVVLDGKTVIEGFWLGFYWGIALWGLTVYWAFVYHVVALPGLVISMALYSSLLGVLGCYLQKRLQPVRLLVFPILWVCIEHLRSSGIYAFPWNVIGYSQYLNLPLLQLASLGSVWIISFLIVLVNVALAQCYLQSNKFRPKAVAVLAMLLVAFSWFWGQRELTLSYPKQGLTIGLVQANFPNDFKFRPENLDLLIEQTRELKNNKPQLVVWTETAIMHYITTDAMARRKIFELAKEMNAHILLGAPNMEMISEEEIKYYNSAFLVTPKEEIAGVYSKMHLVPFGEFLPLARRFKWIEWLEAQVNSGGFSEGEEYKVFELGAQRFASLICFEGVFDPLVRRFVNQGAQFMVNITNDGWSNSSASHYQHLAFASFRAVENRVFFIRAGNTGVSAFIDPLGRIYAQTKTFVKAALVEQIGLPGNKTFYNKYGNLFMGLLWLGLGSGVAWTLKNR